MPRALLSITVCLTFALGGDTARAAGGSWIEDALRAFPLLDLREPKRDPLGQDTSTTTTPHPSVARIVVPETDGTSYGSGTLVDVRGEYGLVVTNWHVVEDMGQELWVEFPDGFRSAGKLLKVDRDWDLAAIAIWKPNAAPVALATEAPRPGDPLVIAGYGSGPFRAARGECLQYVTPSLTLPLEMVQVAVAARNGDSGGPIFNERGELAGVLFGTGEGVTSGSYCGRVNAFLASVLPKEAPAEKPSAAPAVSDHGDIFGSRQEAPAESPSKQPNGVSPLAATHAPPATVQDFGLLDSIEPPPVESSTTEPAEQPPPRIEEPEEAPARRDATEPAQDDNATGSDASLVPASVVAPTHSEVDWLELLGRTNGERLKSALALVGFCTLLWHTIRIVGGRPATHPTAGASAD